jgi:hypothetical protein
MIWVICGAVFGAAFLAAAYLLKDSPSSRPAPPEEHAYTCWECGASVVTQFRLDGLCERCWGDRFEITSDRDD